MNILETIEDYILVAYTNENKGEYEELKQLSKKELADKIQYVKEKIIEDSELYEKIYELVEYYLYH